MRAAVLGACRFVENSAVEELQRGNRGTKVPGTIRTVRECTTDAR